MCDPVGVITPRELCYVIKFNLKQIHVIMYVPW